METENSLPPSQPPNMSLSWATAIQSMPTQPTSWRPILILSSHLRLRLPSGLFPSGILHRKPVYTSPVPHTCHTTCPSHVKKYNNLCSVIHGPGFGWILWRAVNTMNLRLLYTVRNALTSWTTNRISKLSVPWSLAVQVIYQIHTKLSVIKVFYLPTDAQDNCFKKNTKIYIKTASTCFGAITIIRERIIRAC